MKRIVLALGLAALTACGASETSVAREEVAAPGFVGAWKGTKTYYAADGTAIGWAPDWTFEIVLASDGVSLEFVNGPKAQATSPTELTLQRFAYPPMPSPGPSGGHCNPVQSTITGGTGTLEEDGSLTLHVFWNQTCGGTTTPRHASFSMTRIPALSPAEWSSVL